MGRSASCTDCSSSLVTGTASRSVFPLRDVWPGAYRRHIRDLWNEVIADAGLPKHIFPHVMSHTCCTWLKHLRVVERYWRKMLRRDSGPASADAAGL
jgi:hypothetical protein